MLNRDLCVIIVLSIDIKRLLSAFFLASSILGKSVQMNLREGEKWVLKIMFYIRKVSENFNWIIRPK